MTLHVRGALTLVLLAGSALAACGRDAPRSPTGTDDGRAGARARAPGSEPHVAGYMVASLGERTIGPFLARRGTGPSAAGMVAWLTVAEGSGRRVIAMPVGANGAPRGGERVVANVSVDTTMLVVRPMRGPAPGFLLAWTSLTDRGESVWTQAVGDDGVPRAKPTELTRTSDDVVWVDIVPTDVGALALWAEETREGDANLVAAPINTDGKVRGSSARVARGIAGWHALELPLGVGVSTVGAAPAGARNKAQAQAGGALSFHRLDVDGHPVAPPAILTTKPIASGDVEVVRDGSRVLFAWTDRSGDMPSVDLASLDEKNVVLPPRKAVEARGGASLLSLTTGAHGPALMFEAPARRKGEARRVHITRVDETLGLSRPPLSLDIVGRGHPELASTSSGFAVLATTPDCDPGAANCPGASNVTSVLRTNERLELVQREALTFQADPATLGWGMTCDGEICFTLAASTGPAGAPSRIRTAAVRPRTNVKAVAAKSDAPRKDGPHVVDITAVASGESIVDIATTRIGEATLVAMLGTTGDGASLRKGAPAAEAKAAGVTLSTRMVDEHGVATPPLLLSNRALPIGGVAIAAAGKPEDGAAIAWVARENGDPEVHVTRVDKRGRRTNDVVLTTAKGDASDVTLTWAGSGWIVAWVDGRHGNNEVYATRVGTDLSRSAREERITNAPGDATDLTALARGDAVWLAWADSRESPRDGLADIYVSAVRMRDAKRVFDEQRVLPTAAHSRTPHLTAAASGVHVAWIEEAPMDSESPDSSGYGAFWARLDPTGKPLEKPARIALAGDGAAVSVAIDASSNLHAVVARSGPDALSLDAIDLSATPAKAASLLSLDGPPTLDVALVFDGSTLYFNDDGPRIVDRRARRARIGWTAAR